MNDLVRLQDLIAAKHREIGDLVLATAGDVMSADMDEADRGQVALGLLALFAKGRPAPVTIEHVPTPKQIETRTPAPEYVAKRTDDILQTGTLPEPVVRSEPVTEMRAPPAVAAAAPTSVVKRTRHPNNGRKLRFTDDMIAGALAAKSGHAEAAAVKLGCSRTVITKYRQRNGLTRSAGAAKSHPRYEQKPAMAVRSERRERKCMTCTKPFPSDGNHNRLCMGCRHLSEGMAA